VPGQDFDASKLDPAIVKGIDAAPKPAQEKISVYLKEALVTGDAKLRERLAVLSRTPACTGTGYPDRAMITW